MEKRRGFMESMIRSWLSKTEKVTPAPSLIVPPPAADHRVVCAVVEEHSQKEVKG